MNDLVTVSILLLMVIHNEMLLKTKPRFERNKSALITVPRITPMTLPADELFRRRLISMPGCGKPAARGYCLLASDQRD